MDVDACLARIGETRPTRADATTLRRLHLAFLTHVPFETLDIPLGRTIDCDLAAFEQKVVGERRGGFCYELNGLFAALLGALGFEVRRLSARVFRADGGVGPEFDHMLLAVDAHGPRGTWLADVGFGDSFLAPLPDDGAEHEERSWTYRVRVDGAAEILERRSGDGDWDPQYAFTRTPRELAEFAPACAWQQTSPESVFRQKWTCSLPTDDGRITLASGRWIVTRGDRREERLLSDGAELRQLLAMRFGIELPGDAPLAELLAF